MVEYAKERPEIDAPYNSMESEDNFIIYHSSDESIELDEEGERKEFIATKDDKKFDKKLLDVSPFRMEAMQHYPYRFREGDVPIKLLKKPDPEFLIEAGAKI